MSVFLTDDEINTFAKNGFSENDIQDTINGYRSEGLDDNAIRSRIDQRLNSWKPAQPKPQAKPQTSSINQPVKKQSPAYNSNYADILNNNSLTREQKAQAIRERGEAERKQINKERNQELKTIWGRGALGTGLAGASMHPVFNIPYVGTGIGGAMVGAGSAINEGKKLKDIAKEAGQGFVIGETVGAVPYVGKLAAKTKAGQAVVNKASQVAADVAKTQTGQAVGKALEKTGEVLTKERHIVRPQTIYNNTTAKAAQNEIKQEIADLATPEMKNTNIKMSKQGRFWSKNIDDPLTKDINSADAELNSIIKEISKNPDIVNDAQALENFEKRLADKVNFPDEDLVGQYYTKYYEALDKASNYGNVAKDLELSNMMRAKGELKQSQLAQKAKLPDDLKKSLKDNPPEYEVLHNDTIRNEAANIIENNPNSYGELLAKGNNENAELSALDFETARQTVSKLYQEGKIDEALNLTDLISKKASKAGQSVQALSLWGRTTPEGAVRQAQNIIKEFNQKAKKKIPNLTENQVKEIQNLAENIQKTEAGTRDNQIAVQLLNKYLRDLVPVSAGSKLRTLQNISLLLNPKTFERNIAGNSIFAGMENAVTKPIAAGVDRLASLFTKQRTRTLPQLKEYAQGLGQGFKEGVEDVSLGINTRNNLGTRFNLNDGASFQNVPVLGQIEKGLNYSLQVPDRMFYQAAFNESVANQMKAAGLTAPTDEIIKNATNEALEAVFQNNSALGNMVLKMRQSGNQLANLNGYGLGDAFIPYAQTPANIAQQGINYSPLGLGNAIRNFAQGNQRQATLDTARAITGSGLMGLGAYGATNGFINPNIDNYEVQKNYEALGIRPNTLNIGDYNISYNQLQPLAAPIAGGAAITDVLNGDVMQGVDRSLGSVIDLGMLQTANKFMADMNDNGLGTATANLVASIPSRFVPTALKQVNDLIDNTQRDTYDANPIKQGVNQAVAKIPGLAQTLPVKYDITGQPMKKYQTEGVARALDATANPVFVNKRKNDPTMQELINLYETTGDKSVLMPMADKKVQFKDLQGNKVVRPLNAKERNDYQQQLGVLNKQILDDMISTPFYNNLDNEDKVNIINAIKRYNKNYVDENLWGKPNARKRNLIKRLTDDERTKVLNEIINIYKNDVLPVKVDKIYNENFNP